jgi:outer membrane receptor for ferrienterochelin and colicins
MTNENGGNSRMKGAEISLSGNFDCGARWSADWTYTDVENRLLAGLNPVSLQIDFEKTTPKHRGNFNLGWSGEHWDADAYVHYVGSFAFPLGYTGETHLDAYATLAMRIGYRFDEGLTVSFSGRNLTETSQAQSNGMRAPRQFLFSIDKGF